MRALLPTIGGAFPPVERLALDVGMLQHARGVPNVAPAADAEAPELLRRALVAVHEIVELEDVDLARVEPLEPRPQTRDQRRKLPLVVSRHSVARSHPGGLFFRTPPRHSAAPLQRPTTKDDVTADVAFRRKQQQRAPMALVEEWQPTAELELRLRGPAAGYERAMAIPVAAALKLLTKLGPIVGPEAVKLAKKLVGEKKLRNAAHDLAWQRNGLVGEVRFTDGGKRWVVVTADNEPIAAFPPYGSGDADLNEGLRGVDFARCMGPSKRVAEQQQQREKDAAKAREEAAKQRDKEAKAREKAAKQREKDAAKARGER